MLTNYDIEVAFKNAVIKAAQETCDLPEDFSKYTSIKDVNTQSFSVHATGTMEATMRINTLKKIITKDNSIYDYLFECTFIPKELTKSENTIIINTLAVTSINFQLQGGSIDYTAHVDEV